MASETRGSGAGPAWPGPDPDDITAWTVVRAGHAVGRRFWRELGALGLTPVQFGVLLRLQLTPGMSNAEIARHVLVTPQSMSELLESLVELDLVEREPARGRGHRRTARLTPAGQERLRQCADAVARVDASLGLTAAQHRAVRSGLHTTMSALDGAADA